MCHLVREVCSVRYNAGRMSQNKGHHDATMQFPVENWDKNVMSSKNNFEVWVSVTFVTSRLQTLLTIYGKVSYLHQGDLAGWLLCQFLT